jgi:hypothetical protein
MVGVAVACGVEVMSDALEELKDAGKDRDKETSGVWRAQYDYTLGKLSSFLAYVNEYNYLLGQLRKEPPPRDPKVHRGWRMVPDQAMQSGADTKKLAREAEAVWTRMIKDYKDTPWEDRARKESQTLLGLKWEATGGTKTMVHLTLNNVQYDLDPLQFGQSPEQLKDPAGSGGLLMALYQYRRLLTLGPSGFEQYAYHGGREPFYPFPTSGSPPKSLADLRVDTEVLQTEHNAVPAKWYFALKDQALLGFEIKIEDSDDPCEVYLSDYRPVGGRQLPHRLEVRYKDQQFGVLNIQSYQLAAAR